MLQHICNKCGKIIEGLEEQEGKIRKNKVPCLPWTVRIETRYWKGHSFDLCRECKKELIESLKYPSERWDC